MRNHNESEMALYPECIPKCASKSVWHRRHC